MSSKPRPLHTYAVSTGFSNSRRHSAKLRRLLRQAGYQEAHELKTADVIIAHSAGCYRLPNDTAAQLVLLIGVPMNKGVPRHTYAQAQRKNIQAFRESGHRSRLMYIGFWGSVDLVLHPRKNYRLVQTVKSNRHALPVIRAAQIAIISGRHDPWPEPVKELAATSEHGYSFLSLSGSHSHIWQAPEEYVEIINAYATRLLA